MIPVTVWGRPEGAGKASRAHLGGGDDISKKRHTWHSNHDTARKANGCEWIVYKLHSVTDEGFLVSRNLTTTSATGTMKWNRWISAKVKIYLWQQADRETQAEEEPCYLQASPPRRYGDQATPRRAQLWDVPAPNEDEWKESALIRSGKVFSLKHLLSWRESNRTRAPPIGREMKVAGRGGRERTCRSFSIPLRLHRVKRVMTTPHWLGSQISSK